MAGETHESTKCPFCFHIDGVAVGDCPTGTMTVGSILAAVPGFPECNSAIVVTYQVGFDLTEASTRYSLHRRAYFPDNPNGRRIVDLLKIGWDRRLLFRIGTSATTGIEDTLVWAVHHKTSLSGGILAYGYPDDSYLQRVELELNSRGVF
ncbi:E3 ubiquitin-protein ligase dtx3l [Physocladia obscura]|uniref:RING-type E3 ubiquitin transferase n=1 Tax=Physocladia obscura TaxID=109957 RepID=A0AAD5T5M8_9FUNG|nr:E3 ubiquitin-protein ligase dtx3l [Physocladia obscura]